MRKMYLRGAARKTVAAMVLCALIFSTTGVSVYAEGDVDTEVEEEVDDSAEQPSENQNEEISKEPEVSGTSEHQEDESTLTDKTDSKEESDSVGESKDEILSTDNQKNQQEQVVGFELNKEDSALDPSMLEASLIENPNMQNLGCSLPEAPEEPEWSEWESNNNGTHSRHRTVIGENGEETTETETKDCEFVEEVVGDEIVLKCPDCQYVSERWSAKPEITDVSPDEGENNSVFYEPITVSANISCEDVRRSIAASENSTGEELFEAYKNSYDVTLAIQKLESNEEIHIKPEVKLEGDTLTYTWKVPADENEKNIFYVIGGIVATNVKRNVTETYKLNYTVYISDPEEVIQKASFTVNGKDDFSYDADDMSQHWYSNKGDKTDNLKVRISSESYGNKVLKIDSFEEIKDGKAIHVYQSSGQPPRVYQVPYEKHFLWWTWTCYRDEVTYDFEYDLPTELDGVHEYLINYSADNVKYTKRLFTYIDNVAPIITPVSYNGSDKPTGSEGAEEGYYREAVKVVLKVEEDNLINPEKLEGITLKNETTGDPIDFCRNSDNEFVATTSGDGVYRISGKELDKAGNENKDFEKTSFTVDTKVPEVEVKFDNDNVKNEKYFNASRTATISVKDTNFGAEDKLESLTINSKVGSPKSGAWEGSGDSYSKKITFDEDGIYDLAFSCKDKAGNSTETTTVKEFVIDTKKPEISVSYNNNNVKNEKYFNAARKATVTINDLSFAESLVKVEKTGDNALPSLDSFSGNENSNSASMTFDKDGKYSFKVTCEDLAGNVSDGFSSDEFIIDTVAPEIEITGVENMSANNGAVEPVINATDLNLVDTDISITVTGSNNGQIALNKVTSNIKDGFNYKLSDIPHEKANDDLYTLEAKITDRAGNETNKKIQYSINRFGSVYVLGDATKKMVDG
nr:Ig-like domain repeat protein [Pseudobutyrivibrio sp.]